MTGDCKRSDVQPVVPLLIYMHICLPSSQAKKTTKKKQFLWKQWLAAHQIPALELRHGQLLGENKMKEERLND